VNCQKGNVRVDRTENKAIENLVDWEPVLQLIDKNETEKAFDLSCIMQQAAKKSDQNACKSLIETTKKERIQKMIARRINYCILIKKELDFKQCLSLFSNL
jgi:hypothetical protein